jgi:hypothetical protein
MASNTQIFIKRSEANSAPGSLNAGELAYSYASNTLFIGANTATGPGYYKIGGQFYTNIIDQATSSNTANTLVYRDLNGDFAAGNVTAAYFIGDGSALTGLVTNLTVDGDTGGPNTINLLTDTLTIAGGEGLTSNVDGNTITLDVDDTVIRANTEMPGTSQHIQTDLQISGNLTVQGSTTFVNTAIYKTVDSLIELAANNTTGDVVDIGFYALHGNTTTAGVDITGLVRNAGTSDYYLFDRVNVGDETDINANTLAQAFTSANSASLYVNKILANQSLGGSGTEGGYSFSGDEGGLDTGMFSPSDGELEFYSNDERIFTANTTLVFFEKDLKLQNSGLINNPNGLLELNPDETNADDRYIVIDPTSPNHIHLRAGGTIDASGADLFLGGEENYVSVSDASANVQIRTNNLYGWEFTNDGKLLLANGTSIYDSTDGNNGFYVDPIRANNAIGGNVTAYNTTTKELVSTDVKITNSGITLANGTVISDGEAGFFVDSLAFDPAPLDQANIVLYNATTGEITYGPIADLNPAQLANGSHTWTISASDGSLYSDQGTALACSANSVVLGTNVDLTNGSTGRVAIGEYAGQITQAQHAIAIGSGAGTNSQDTSAIAIGQDAGANNQSFSAVAVGRWAGQNDQGWDSVAVGRRAGRESQGDYSVAMGWAAANNSQGNYAVAVGSEAGNNNQSNYTVAIGAQAGWNAQAWGATSIGTNAGYDNQGLVATAIGSNAGRYNQSQNAVAIGRRAGETTQGQYAVALGNRAGKTTQGEYSIAIGSLAGETSQGNNSIILNASGIALNGSANGFFVNPIAYTEAQDATYDGLVFYNSNTHEVRYSYALDGGAF